MNKQTVWQDGHIYGPGVEVPDMGSVHNIRANGGRRDYVGLSADVEKLPTYDDLESGSACLMVDTSEVYVYESTTKTWYQQGA